MIDFVSVAKLISDGIKWTEQPNEEKQHNARFFVGVVKSWRFVVSSFDIEDQGFQAGSRGYDGTAISNGIIIRLLRVQAQMLVKDAIEKIYEQ